MKILPLFLLILTAVSDLTGAPLIFKTVKDVKSNEQSEVIATLDTLKYKQIRVAVKFVRAENSYIDPGIKALMSRLESGDITRTEYEKRKRMIEEKSQNEQFSVYGFEDSQWFFLGGGLESFVIETPPPKISVQVFGAGRYSVYVWGS